MSRIGRKPVAIPSGVTVQYNQGELRVKGPKGDHEPLQTHPNITVEVDENAKEIRVTRPDDDRFNRSLHGLMRSLIANMVEGVTQGYEKKLKIEGIGFQGRIDGRAIVLSVGYANQVRLEPPEGVTVEVEKDGVSITVKGVNKQKVGQFAAEIRASRKPEPYKGKGIRYADETIRRKEGKAFGAGAGK